MMYYCACTTQTVAEVFPVHRTRTFRKNYLGHVQTAVPHNRGVLLYVEWVRDPGLKLAPVFCPPFTATFSKRRKIGA